MARNPNSVLAETKARDIYEKGKGVGKGILGRRNSMSKGPGA